MTAIWLLPFYPSPLKDDGYDIADYCDVHPMYRHAGRFQNVPARGAPARPARHHRTGVEPHVRPASVVPARAPRQARQPLAEFLRLERHAEKIQGHAHHLQGRGGFQLDVGPRGQGVFLAPFLFAPARSELRQPGSARDNLQGRWISGWTSAWTACGWTPCRIFTSAKAPTAKISRRRTPS